MRVAEIGWPRQIEPDNGREIGHDEIEVRTFVLDLATAREDFEVSLAGAFIWAINTVNVDAETAVKFNTSAGQGVPFKRGQWISGIRFQRIFVSHVAQAGASITFLCSPRHIEVDNAVATSGLVTLTDTLRSSDFATPAAASVGVAAASFLAASSTRIGVILQSHPDNTGRIVVGDANVTLTRGLILLPGGTAYIQTEDELFAIASVAAQALQIGLVNE